MNTWKRCVVLAILGIAGTASADTTEPVTELSTDVDDVFPQSGTDRVELHTRPKTVTYTDPALVTRRGLTYWEVTGTITGTGWGGLVQLVPHGAQLPNPGPYDYTVSFVLRWVDGWDGTLVSHSHG